MRLIMSMRLFGCSHTHFGIGSAYFSYLLSKATIVSDEDNAIFIFENII